MFFSIIMPIYNAERYMNKAINSILLQNYTDFELIIVNDGSLDYSGEIAKEFAIKDKRIVYLEQDNAGPAEARNNALAHTVGEYILFIDSDDEFKHDALGCIYEQIMRTHAEFICFGYNAIKVKGNKSYTTVIKPYKDKEYQSRLEIAENQLDIINRKYFASLWNKTYKRSVIKENGLIMDKHLFIGEDLCFNLKMLSVCTSYYEFTTPLYCYIMQNGESITNRYKADKDRLMLNIHDFRTSIILSNPHIENNKAYADIHSDYERLCFSCFIDLFSRGCTLSRSEKIRYMSELVKGKGYKYSLKDNKYLTKNRRFINIIFVMKSNLLIYILSRLFFIIKFNTRRYKTVM